VVFSARAGTEAPFHELLDEQVERARHDTSQVAAGQRVPHQVARQLEPLFQ
jgi:hypothetical protein